MNMPTTYLLYLGISAIVTIWVARTLHTRGRVFLLDSFKGKEQLADSINDLLVVGFYLLNFGYVALALRYGRKPENLQESIEFLATKLGLVLMILGGIHFLNLLIFTKIRRRGESPFASSANVTGREIDYGQLRYSVRPEPNNHRDR